MRFQKVSESVVPPKEGLEPKSSLGTLHARVHSREKIKKFCVFFPFFFHASFAGSVRRETEREREMGALSCDALRVRRPDGIFVSVWPSCVFPPFFLPRVIFRGSVRRERDREIDREIER